MTGLATLSSRRGIALLEVLVALALLMTAGTAWIAFVAQSRRSLELLRDRETEIREASMALARISLSERDALAVHLGVDRRVGRFIVRTSSVDRRLFTVTLHDSLSGRHVLGARLYPEPEAPGAQ